MWMASGDGVSSKPYSPRSCMEVWLVFGMQKAKFSPDCDHEILAQMQGPDDKSELVETEAVEVTTEEAEKEEREAQSSEPETGEEDRVRRAKKPKTRRAQNTGTPGRRDETQVWRPRGLCGHCTFVRMPECADCARCVIISPDAPALRVSFCCVYVGCISSNAVYSEHTVSMYVPDGWCYACVFVCADLSATTADAGTLPVLVREVPGGSETPLRRHPLHRRARHALPALYWRCTCLRASSVLSVRCPRSRSQHHEHHQLV